MRKLSLFIATCTALVVFLGLSAPAQAATPDWNQYHHDAQHSGRNAEATGPTWPKVVPGWPVNCQRCFANGGAGPIVSEVTLPSRERTTGVFSGTWGDQHEVYGFDSSGRTLPGWPVALNQGRWGGTVGSPAVGTVDGQSAIFTLDQGSGVSRLYAVGSNGELLSGGWPWTAGPDPSTYAYYGPTLVTDSNGEQTAYVNVRAGSSEDYRIYALDSSGAVKPGWPVSSGPGGSGWFSPAPNSPIVAPDQSVYAKSAEGPFGDERRGMLLGFLPSGDPKPGWPYRFPDRQRLDYTNPAAGDDGTVYVATDYWADRSQPDWLATRRSYLYAFSPAGRVKHGWPREVPGMAFGTPAIAADGTAYFLAVRGIRSGPGNDTGSLTHVYAFSERGEPKPGWPRLVNRCEHDNAFPPLLFGIALDRAGNVFVPGTNVLCDDGAGNVLGGVLHGFTPHGVSLPGWPLQLPNGSALLTPALGNDGTLYTSGLSASGGGKLYAIRSGKPPRCDPRTSHRLCPPIPLEPGKLLPIGTGKIKPLPPGGRVGIGDKRTPP